MVWHVPIYFDETFFLLRSLTLLFHTEYPQQYLTMKTLWCTFGSLDADYDSFECFDAC